MLDYDFPLRNVMMLRYHDCAEYTDRRYSESIEKVETMDDHRLKIRKVLEREGLTQTELSLELDISAQTIPNYLSTASNVGPLVCLLLAGFDRENADYWLDKSELSERQISLIRAGLTGGETLRDASRLAAEVADMIDHPRDEADRDIADFLRKIASRRK